MTTTQTTLERGTAGPGPAAHVDTCTTCRCGQALDFYVMSHCPRCGTRIDGS